MSVFDDIHIQCSYPKQNYSSLDPVHLYLFAKFVYLGYVQGMSDLLSPILFLMEDEVQAFWCFVGFMERVVRNLHCSKCWWKIEQLLFYDSTRIGSLRLISQPLGIFM